ncbi:MAG: recombinase family protein [Bacteroides thetaiotaomicron]
MLLLMLKFLMGTMLFTILMEVDQRKYLSKTKKEVANVKKIFQLALEGYSLGKIAKYFNNRNILFRGHFVTRQLLSVLVRNILYKGIREEFTVSTEKTIPILLKIKSLLLFLKVILSE